MLEEGKLPLETQEVKERKQKKVKKIKEIKAKHRGGKRKKERQKNKTADIVLVVAVLVFLFSAFKLCSIFFEYSKGEKEYEHIAETVVQKIETTVENEENTVVEEPKFVVDFAALQAINADTIGWIRFDEPAAISYPVVKGPDNDKYLNTTFEGKKNAAGTLFIDMSNSRDFSDQNTFIYGHNMKNGSMFGQLRKFKNSTYCEENPYFYIYKPDGMCAKYQIFSVAIVKDTSDTYTRYFEDEAAYVNYIQYVKSTSLFATNVEVGADSQIVTLSTCTNVRDDERLVVHGVLVDLTRAGE